MSGTVATTLKKSLGLVDVFCLSVGAMISAGIFLLPGVAFSHIGPAIIFSYLLGGLFATFGTFSALELATAMPQAGGVYYFTTRSLGPLAGTVSGILDWASLSLKSAFAIYGTAQIVNQFFPSLPPVPVGIGITMFFLGVNLLSTEAAALLQQIMVYFLLAIMVTYVGFGMLHLQVASFSPFFFNGKGIFSIFTESGFIFVSFGGLLGVISVAEEVRDPQRNLPIGILASLAVVTLLYGLVIFVTVGVVPADLLIQSHAPLADAARQQYGTLGFLVLTAGALLAFVTTGNAGIMGAARYPMALARDNLMPPIFARVYGERDIPVPALIFTGVMMCTVQFLPLQQLVQVASTVVMLSYILTNASVVILRESGVLNYRPSFRTPLYPSLPIFSVIVFVCMIFKLGDLALGLSFLIILASTALYFCYGRKVHKETALMQLVGRLTNSQVSTDELEHELRDVVRKRDNIVTDGFDDAVENSFSLIIKEPLSLKDFFDAVVHEIAPVLGVSREQLVQQLIDREESSSTVISPGVAVPHLTIENRSNLFVSILVKCDPGVVFNEDLLPVNTVVFLFSSPDQRSHHLRGLAIIAQTILGSKFEARWSKARTPHQLKDIFLLAHRNRAHHKDGSKD